MMMMMIIIPMLDYNCSCIRVFELNCHCDTSSTNSDQYRNIAVSLVMHDDAFFNLNLHNKRRPRVLCVQVNVTDVSWSLNIKSDSNTIATFNHKHKP